MQSKELDQHVQLFIETCHHHQLKITPQRVAIYRGLIQSKQHPTADLMFRTVKEEFPNISFDTVNRTLLTFAGIGVVDVVEEARGPYPAKYRLVRAPVDAKAGTSLPTLEKLFP